MDPLKEDQINSARDDKSWGEVINLLKETGLFCHALNQPLQAIMMTVEMMQDDATPGSEEHENLEIIMTECEKISDEIKKFAPRIKDKLSKL